MSQEWYVFKNGQQEGPFTREQLVRQAGDGILVPDDMLWTEGMADWTRADQVEGLLPVAPPPPAAPLPPPVAPPPPQTAPPPPSAPLSPGGGPRYQQSGAGFPGPSPYQQGPGSGSFPGAPAAGKQGKGLIIALGIILVGIIIIGGFLLYQLLF